MYYVLVTVHVYESQFLLAYLLGLALEDWDLVAAVVEQIRLVESESSEYFLFPGLFYDPLF